MQRKNMNSMQEPSIKALIEGYDQNLFEYIAEHIVVSAPMEQLRVPFKKVFQDYKHFSILKNILPMKYKDFRQQFLEILKSSGKTNVRCEITSNTYILFNIKLIDRMEMLEIYKKFYKI